MKNPGGYIGEALVSCGAIKPKKRVTARDAARKYEDRIYEEQRPPDGTIGMAGDGFLAGVAWQKRQAKRGGK